MGLPSFRNPKHRHLKALLVPEALLALLCVANVSLVFSQRMLCLDGQETRPLSCRCKHDLHSRCSIARPLASSQYVKVGRVVRKAL